MYQAGQHGAEASAEEVPFAAEPFPALCRRVGNRVEIVFAVRDLLPAGERLP